MANMQAWRYWERGEGMNRNFHVLTELRKRHAFTEIIAVDVWPHDFSSGLREQAQMTLQPYQGVELGGGLFARHTSVEEDFSIIELPEAGIFKGPYAGEERLERLVLKRWPEGPDVVWCYTPFLSYLPYRFLQAKTVFDAVDDWREHTQFTARRAELEGRYKDIRDGYNAIFTVSESLRDGLFAKTKAHWIPNGVDLTHFSRRPKEAWPANIAALPRPIIGYAGVIESRVDEEILSAIADAYPNGSLVLAGPVWRKDAAFKKLAARPNVHLLGAKPYADVPTILSACDIGIIPHKVNAFTKSMNPLKLYEYLAIGLPVVTTPIAGLTGFEKGVHVASTPAAFVDETQNALTQKKDPAVLRALVENHGWDRRVDRMLEIIDALPTPSRAEKAT